MKLTGDRNQCRTCGQYFNSSKAFDKHRIGSFSKDTRRCMSQDEMLAAGMVLRDDGFWRGQAMTTDGQPSFYVKAKDESVA